MSTWQLQEARRHFSEVVDRAVAEGPQRVTRRGQRAVVIVAEEEWQRLQAAKPSFGDLLASFPGTAEDLPQRRMARVFREGNED